MHLNMKSKKTLQRRKYLENAKIHQSFADHDGYFVCKDNSKMPFEFLD